MNDNHTDGERQDKKIILSGIFVEGFGIIPKLLMKADDLSLTTKAVICYLLSYTGAGAESWPRHDEIIKNLGISKRTLARSINQAMDAGYMTRKRKFSRGIGSRNIYHLSFMENFRTATRAPSKNKKVPSCPKEGSPEHPPYKNKQEKKHFGRERAEKSPYPEFKERIDDAR